MPKVQVIYAFFESLVHQVRLFVSNLQLYSKLSRQTRFCLRILTQFKLEYYFSGNYPFRCLHRARLPASMCIWIFPLLFPSHDITSVLLLLKPAPLLCRVAVLKQVYQHPKRSSASGSTSCTHYLAHLTSFENKCKILQEETGMLEIILTLAELAATNKTNKALQ